MKKQIPWLVSLPLICILLLVGSHYILAPDVTSPSDTISPVKEKYNIPLMAMIDGVLYYNTGRESELQGRCGVMDGTITSETDASETPTKDNQSNFGTGYSYQYVSEGKIEFWMNAKWVVFERYNGND